MTEVTPHSWLRVAAALAGIAWGANQFATVLIVYRVEDGVSQTAVALMFAAYVVGLGPALLGAAWLATRYGKRPIVRGAMILALLGTVFLVIGAEQEWALYVGRIISGAATGAAMGPGTAWIKELSAGDAVGTGSRRAAIALTLGFGGGPLVAGLLAQFAPAPQVVPYLAHLIVMAAIAVVSWSTPEQPVKQREAPAVATVLRRLGKPWFLLLVAPAAPWAFAATTLGFVALPAQVDLGEWIILVISLITALTMGAGVIVQGPIRRFADLWPRQTVSLGIVLAMLGLLVGIVLATFNLPWLLIVSSILLGSAYGALVVGGLHEVERHVPLAELSLAAAIFYCLTYIGFFASWVIALFENTPPWQVLGTGFAIAAITLVIIQIGLRRTRQ